MPFENSIGPALCQVDDEGKLRMIHTFSRNLDQTQRNYSVTDKELLGVVKAKEFFRHYLAWTKITLETDHKSLENLQSTEKTSSRLMRLSLFRQDFNFAIKHIPGCPTLQMDSADMFIVSYTTLTN